MSGPSVYLRMPPAAIFKFPPADLPKTVPPPLDEGTLRAPTGISPGVYNAALEPSLPFTFAAVYILVVFALNSYNRSRTRGAFNKPWWISTTNAFKTFVIVHNVVLAVYSFWTFVAMARAITEVLYGVFEHDSAWPAHLADALCKMHGPRGLGDAATYNTSINIWEAKNTLIKLDPRLGTPDQMDVGRLWNEGLAFWGWLFYISKFYEVMDTLIIVAKGKRSATLQTYHHAGAMLCMWAGIRYMSPPIWMFVFINSGIHAMMYTYFTLSALNIRVSQTVKRTLTTLQIVQFVFGASYAAAHLFVAYDIPIETPYQIASTVQRAASSASSAAVSVTSAISEAVATPIVTAPIGSLIKKYLLRAAGEEGIAEQVPITTDRFGQPSIPSPIAERIERFNEVTYETRWRTDWTKVDCIDTSGEAFAIYLNLFYLFPLTMLFGRFFYKAYTQRGRARAESKTRRTLEAAKAAGKRTSDSVEKSGKKAEREIEQRGSEAKKAIDDTKAQETLRQMQEDLKNMKDNMYAKGRRVSENIGAKVEDYEQKIKDLAAERAEKAKENNTSTPRKASPSKKAAPETNGKMDESVVEEESAPAAKEETQKKPRGSPKKLSRGGASKEAGGSPKKNSTGNTSTQGKGDGSGDAQNRVNGDQPAENEKEKENEPTAEGEDTYAEVAKAPPPSSEGTKGDAEEEDTDAMGKSGLAVEDSTADIKEDPQPVSALEEGEEARARASIRGVGLGDETAATQPAAAATTASEYFPAFDDGGVHDDDKFKSSSHFNSSSDVITTTNTTSSSPPTTPTKRLSLASTRSSTVTTPEHRIFPPPLDLRSSVLTRRATGSPQRSPIFSSFGAAGRLMSPQHSPTLSSRPGSARSNRSNSSASAASMAGPGAFGEVVRPGSRDGGSPRRSFILQRGLSNSTTTLGLRWANAAAADEGEGEGEQGYFRGRGGDDGSVFEAELSGNDGKHGDDGEDQELQEGEEEVG